jgi:hypothetical protein
VTAAEEAPYAKEQKMKDAAIETEHWKGEAAPLIRIGWICMAGREEKGREGEWRFIGLNEERWDGCGLEIGGGEEDGDRFVGVSICVDEYVDNGRPREDVLGRGEVDGRWNGREMRVNGDKMMGE